MNTEHPGSSHYLTRFEILLAAEIILVGWVITAVVAHSHIKKPDPTITVSIRSGMALVTTEEYRGKACAALLAGAFEHFWINHKAGGLELVKAENCRKLVVE